jgi:hypothetical protein
VEHQSKGGSTIRGAVQKQGSTITNDAKMLESPSKVRQLYNRTQTLDESNKVDQIGIVNPSHINPNANNSKMTQNKWIEELSPKFNNGPRQIKGNNPNISNYTNKQINIQKQ